MKSTDRVGLLRQEILKGWTEKVDDVAKAMEDKWGIDRLKRLVDPELAARFCCQIDLWNDVLLDGGKLRLRALEVLGARQRCDQSVARGELAVVLAFGKGDLEVPDGVWRVALIASQQRAHEVEVERIGDLLGGFATVLTAAIHRRNRRR